MTLVLLPGMDGTGRLFAPFVLALGPDVETVVVPYPEDAALDWAGHEAVARAALPADRPYVLLGESFSGPVAVRIAASAPPRLAGLVLCASFVRNPRPSLGPLRPLTAVVPGRRLPTGLLARILLGRFATPALRRALGEALADVSPAALRARARAILDVDVVAALARVTVPVLVLRATEDRVVPAAATALVAATLPAARVVDVEAPHLLLQAAPAAAARAVLPLLR